MRKYRESARSFGSSSTFRSVNFLCVTNKGQTLTVAIGPVFTQNAGAKAVADITVAFHYDHELYRLEQSLLLIPLVIPVRWRALCHRFAVRSLTCYCLFIANDRTCNTSTPWTWRASRSSGLPTTCPSSCAARKGTHRWYTVAPLAVSSHSANLELH